MSRLIDADELEFHRQLEPRGNGEYEYVDVIYKNDVDDAPTIEDVQPVVRGKWIDGTKRQTCSICRYRGVRSWNYCPSCGAKMETSHE